MLQNSKDCENCCVTFTTQTINGILNNHLQFTGAHCWAFQQLLYAHGHKILFANCSVCLNACWFEGLLEFLCTFASRVICEVSDLNLCTDWTPKNNLAKKYFDKNIWNSNWSEILSSIFHAESFSFDSEAVHSTSVSVSKCNSIIFTIPQNCFFSLFVCSFLTEFHQFIFLRYAIKACSEFCAFTIPQHQHTLKWRHLVITPELIENQASAFVHSLSWTVNSASTKTIRLSGVVICLLITRSAWQMAGDKACTKKWNSLNFRAGRKKLQLNCNFGGFFREASSIDGR